MKEGKAPPLILYVPLGLVLMAAVMAMGGFACGGFGYLLEGVWDWQCMGYGAMAVFLLMFGYGMDSK